MATAVFCEVDEDWQQEYLEEKISLEDWKLEFFSEGIDTVPEDIRSEAEVLSVFIRSDCSREELEGWSDLSLIATRSTGYDHIDIDFCDERGISVCNVPTYGDNTVAEHTFALILGLSRRIQQAVLRTQRGEFSCDELRGFDLRNRTIGVIGTGHIGKHVIKMARGFGMDVVAYDLKEDSFVAELLGFEYVDMPELLERSHIISLHCPLTEQTKHMLGQKEFERCRDGVLVINTARGGLIDSEALLDALDEGKVGGAGLDVIEGEDLILEEPKIIDKDFDRQQLRQLVQGNQILKRDDVIFTPHMAYNSQEAVERILDTTAGNINAFARGESCSEIISGD
ncbi:MAG: hydroxyacid dehydrogenase [bacterium]